MYNALAVLVFIVILPFILIGFLAFFIRLGLEAGFKGCQEMCEHIFTNAAIANEKEQKGSVPLWVRQADQ